MSEALGATPEEWYAFDFELGLSKNLLPCVPASPDVQVVPGSDLNGKIGKIPSQFNAAGLAHGLKDWQKREILENEIALWRKDRRLNLCVRTGHLSGVYAFDVDVDNMDLAVKVQDILAKTWMGDDSIWASDLPIRTRPNSNKILIPFRMEEVCKKQVIKLDHERKGARIELLGDGQQFVAAGTHSSGARYAWAGGLPSRLPLLTLSQVQDIWTTLTKEFAVGDKITSTFTIMPMEMNLQTSNGPNTSSILNQIDETSWQELIVALRFMLDKVADNDFWSEIGYALLSIKQTRPAEQLWYDFSRKAVGYEEGAPQAWWSAHSTQIPHSDWRHIFTLAHEAGWKRQSTPDDFPSESSSAEELDVEPPPLPEKPVVKVCDPELATNVRQIEAILQPELFCQGNVLTRKGRENVHDGVRRSTGDASKAEDLKHPFGLPQIMLIPATMGWARVHLCDTASFLEYSSKKDSWYPISPPRELVQTFFDQGDWPNIRPLDAIARAPFVRFDGSICYEPGYDPKGRTLHIPSAAFPAIPETGADGRNVAKMALARLCAPFDQFPWYNDSARSAFAAHILTEAARLAFDRSPMFWYTAPDAGTGKSLLSGMPGLIVHGSEPALRPWVQDGDELRKTLFASLLAGDRSIAFDNVPTGFKARAPELCAFLTSAIWKDRKLGVSEALSVPNKAVVSASGNNVTPVSDLARRCLVVRLDARSERIRERRFRISDLRSYVLEHRPELLIDALTIIKAYHDDKGIDLVPLPSFEGWSKLVREPLIWLDLPDPCATQITETDDETGSLSEVFKTLHGVFGDRNFSCVELARFVGSIADVDGQLGAMMMVQGCQEPNSPKHVGYWLRGLRDRQSGGFKLKTGGTGPGGALWTVRPQNEDLT